MVKIIDVSHGKKSVLRDPHGVRWQIHDPLINVGFYNPKELTESGIPSDKIQHLSRDRIPALYLPASMWQRTAMCYLRDEGPGGSDDGPSRWRIAIDEALNHWRKDLSLAEQQGTSNTASPQVPRVTPRSADRRA